MSLLSLRGVSLSFGAEPLLDGVDLHVEEGERISLLGRNGAGKSTLLGVLSGSCAIDDGVIDRRPGLRVSVLSQQVPAAAEVTVRAVVTDGVPPQHEAPERAVDTILSRLGIEGDQSFGPLSAGNKRRVHLAKALVGEPDVLLLDEPTNHLDIDAIRWLEDFLLRWDGTLLFVTHDRALLGRLATRIIELDRGQLYSFAGDYASYLRRREAALVEEERHAAAFDKKLAAEEVWLRQGIKARRTRNEGRKRALLTMRNQRSKRRERVGKVRMNLQEAERSGKLVVVAREVGFAYQGGGDIVRGLSTIILRGDKVGVIGPNGCGKTTLVRALLGELEPTSGAVKIGSRVEVAYFDQLREQLDESASVRDNVSAGADNIQVDGMPRHVMSYLADWLFSGERARTPVSALSGGERNRLLLARLFLKPSNLLVLDEPTNDLDVETLELLEERLISYQGTVIVVSHDRAFIDNIASSTLAWEGPGRFVEYAGGYSDWQRQRGVEGESVHTSLKTKGHKPKTKTKGPPKLTFAQKRELEQLPAIIEGLEAEQATLHARMADPDFYQQGGDAIADANARLEPLQQQLEQAYARWQTLEEIAELNPQ